MVVLRDAMVVVLAVLVVRSVLHPETDPVRELGADDPDRCPARGAAPPAEPAPPPAPPPAPATAREPAPAPP
jgi:hypothetical protein